MPNSLSTSETLKAHRLDYFRRVVDRAVEVLTELRLAKLATDTTIKVIEGELFMPRQKANYKYREYRAETIGCWILTKKTDKGYGEVDDSGSSKRSDIYAGFVLTTSGLVIDYRTIGSGPIGTPLIHDEALPRLPIVEDDRPESNGYSDSDILQGLARLSVRANKSVALDTK